MLWSVIRVILQLRKINWNRKTLPVDLPPPKFVLNPNANTRSAVHLYILASFSLISDLGTVAWKKNWEHFNERQQEQYIYIKFLLDWTRYYHIMNDFLPCLDGGHQRPFVGVVKAVWSWIFGSLMLRYLPTKKIDWISITSEL